MKTSRISLNQMFTLLILYLTASATLSNVGRLSGPNIWIVMLIAAVLGSILFVIYHRISYLHGYQSLTLILQDVFGKVLGSLVVLVYSGYFLYMGYRIVISTGNMIQFTVMEGASMFLILGLLALVIWYGMMLGFNTIGRASELLFYLVLISFIPLVLGVFTSGIFNFDHFFPILEHGFKEVIPEIYKTTVFPYGELIAFLVIFPLVPKAQSPKILKVGFAALICGTILLLMVDIFNIGILGEDLVYNFVYPFFNSMKMVGVNIFFERLDPLAIIILMTTCFFKICVYFYAGTSLINGVLKKINHKIISLPILVVMCLCGAHFQESQVENLNQILNVNPTYLLPIFELAIPVLVWIISEIKYHKHPIEKSETN